MVNFCAFAAISLVIGVAGILTVSLLYSLTGGVTPMKYGVVVDAGSSHSEIILYEWKGDKDRGTGRVVQESSCEAHGGLAKNTSASAAADRLKPCLTKISNLLKPEDLKSTSFFLGGTAGFRLLNETNHTLSDSILQEVNSTADGYGFKPDQVRVLTGEEEGLYGWLTANFISENLQSTTSLPTVGAMDLGGASTQVAYTVQESQNNSIDLKLYGHDYHIMSRSALCFGVDEIYNRHLSVLVLQNCSATEDIEEPCAPQGFSFSKTSVELSAQPCTNTTCNEDSKDLKVYNFKGISNEELCLESVKSLLNFSTCNKHYPEDYCFKPDSVPTETQKYVAFSAFYYTTSFLNSTNVTLDSFYNATVDLCNKTWDEVKDMKTNKNETLSRYCFQALYIYQMLTEVYNFTETSWQHISFVEKIKGTNAGWALGYMINATNSIPAQAPSEKAIPSAPFIILLLLCISLLFLGAYFVWKRIRHPPTDVNYVQV